MKTRTILTIGLGASLLSGCYSSSPRPLPPMAPQEPTVEGAWVDPNGIVSTFQAGAFSTRTTDTNQLLAQGTYTNVSDKLVEINMTSLVRNTQARVNCAMVTVNQLNCTSDSGTQFTLARQG